MESRLQAAGASDASLAVWTSDAKAVGSFTARSARILRSTSIPAVFSPLMNLEYDRPCGRTAALIRAIHSRRNWPLRSRRSRLAVARWVFVFGMSDLPFVRCGGRFRVQLVQLRLRSDDRIERGGDGRDHLLPRLACPFLRECLEMPLVGADHHDHVAPLLLRHRFNHDQFAEVGDETIEDPETQIRVRHLSPTEHDRDLDLVHRLEEPRDVPLLRGVVVRVDLRAELDLFQPGARLLLARFLLADISLVLELAVVHDPTHGWISLRRYLNEVQIQLTRLTERFTRVHHADL